MNPERGERIRTIFEAALRCEPAGRAALLDTLCGNDSELRTEVERLLADDERASRDRFLTDPSPPGQGEEGHRPGLLGLRGLDIHILCPHCRNPIELVGLTAADVVCPACAVQEGDMVNCERVLGRIGKGVLFAHITYPTVTNHSVPLGSLRDGGGWRGEDCK